MRNIHRESAFELGWLLLICVLLFLFLVTMISEPEVNTQGQLMVIEYGKVQ